MAQDNLSVVLHAQGDLRLVGKKQQLQYLHVYNRLRGTDLSSFLCFLCILFIFLQDKRPVPEPGPNGKPFTAMCIQCISVQAVQHALN